MRRVSLASLRTQKQLSVASRSLSYVAPIQDCKFLIYDVLKLNKGWEKMAATLPAAKHLTEDCAPDVVDAILESAAEFAVEQLLPLYQPSDAGVVYNGQTQDVTTPPGFKEAYDAYGAAGWGQVHIPLELGGQGLPTSVNLAKTEFVATSNWSWSMYPGLTLGAVNTLLLHGSDAQKEKYVQRLSSGEWSGTMCLTEPHCGTDLGLIKTKAEPVDDRASAYKITGTKIFISCGEHDLSDNIIHIVLAKLPNGPPGVKGISLFIVPKYTDEEMKKPKAQRKKNIVCAGVEKKMGIHGSATCMMSFENSVGYLIGLPHDGLRQMFTFMNTARLGVALQGVAHSELAYQNAYKYAIERRVMSPLSGRVEHDKPADLLINLPEIRRLLLTARVVADGGRYMVMKCAEFADQMTYTKDKKQIEKLEDGMGWFTPVAKGFITELSLEASSNCMQVLGGHGYIRDWGLEQIYRDARIGTMYEGTTAIQGLDLLGRKMFREKFTQFKKYIKHLLSFAFAASRDSVVGEQGRTLLFATISYSRAVFNLALRVRKSKKALDSITANLYDNLFALGYIMLGECFIKQRRVAVKLLKDADASRKPFLTQKIETCDFYFERIMPRVTTHINLIKAKDSTLTSKTHDHFMAR